MNDFLIGLLSSILGGIVVYLIQEYRYKKQKATIEDVYSKKLLTSDIINKLMPGYSISKMKELLGNPSILKSESDWSVFDEAIEIKTNSYLYLLKNSSVKINSSDNTKIDSITIKYKYNTDNYIDISPILLDSFKIKIGKSKVTNEIIELTQNFKALRTMKENCGVIQFTIPNPIYKTFTLFIYSEKIMELIESNNVKYLLGGIIIAVCISDNKDNSYFLFDYELT